MTIKQLGKILIVPSLIALTPVPIWAQADTQTTTPRSSGRAQSGGDAAVTGQSGTDVRQNGGQSTPTSSAGMAASSQEIATLQQALKDRGQDPGAVNGVMTPQTQQALKNFQAQQGLNATGTLDAQSRTALGVGLGGGSSAAGAGAGNSLGTGTGTPIDPTLTPGQDTLPGSSARGTSAPTPSTGLGTQSPSTLPGGTTGSSLPGASTGSTLPGGTSGSIGGTTGSGTGSTGSVGGSGGIGGTGGGAAGGAAGAAGGAGGGR